MHGAICPFWLAETRENALPGHRDKFSGHNKMLCMESPRTVDEKLKGDTFSQMLGFPTPEPTLNTNFVNLKHFGSPQSSKHYQTVLLMSSNTTLNKYNENYKQKKLGEPNCNKLKNILCNGGNIQLSKICHSHSIFLLGIKKSNTGRLQSDIIKKFTF